MSTAEEIYAADIRTMPPSERLRLAAIILQDLTESTASALDWPRVRECVRTALTDLKT
jgi:hypothetical protein